MRFAKIFASPIKKLLTHQQNADIHSIMKSKSKSKSTSISVRTHTPELIDRLREKFAPDMSIAAFVDFMCMLMEGSNKADREAAMMFFIRRETKRITGK